MSLTKEYYLETLGFDTLSTYDDVEYNNPPLDLFLDETIECNLTEQEIYDALQPKKETHAEFIKRLSYAMDREQNWVEYGDGI